MKNFFIQYLSIYCASEKIHYYRFKIHAVYFVEVVFKSFDISKVSVYDIHYLKAQRVFFIFFIKNKFF